MYHQKSFEDYFSEIMLLEVQAQNVWKVRYKSPSRDLDRYYDNLRNRIRELRFEAKYAFPERDIGPAIWMNTLLTREMASRLGQSTLQASEPREYEESDFSFGPGNATPFGWEDDQPLV